MTNNLSKSKITDFLPDHYKSLPITVYKTIDSTNLSAKTLVGQNFSLPLLVVANEQTAGRGRLGRSFYSPSSTGIYMSLAIGGFKSPQDAVFITSAAAVAVTNAIFSLTGIETGIKWVNDIYLDGKKICGILAESHVSNDRTAIIVGIGINMTTDYFPKEIFNIATSLKTDVPREKMIAEIVRNLLEICKSPQNNNFMEIYKKRSVLLGKEINYFIGSEKKTAVAIDIDAKGGLIVRDNSGDILTLSSGEVTVRLN